jgi:hypothetical protein
LVRDKTIDSREKIVKARVQSEQVKAVLSQCNDTFRRNLRTAFSEPIHPSSTPDNSMEEPKTTTDVISGSPIWGT